MPGLVRFQFNLLENKKGGPGCEPGEEDLAVNLGLGSLGQGDHLDVGRDEGAGGLASPCPGLSNIRLSQGESRVVISHRPHCPLAQFIPGLLGRFNICKSISVWSCRSKEKDYNCKHAGEKGIGGRVIGP